MNAGGSEDYPSTKGSKKPINNLDSQKQPKAKKKVFKTPTIQEIQDFCNGEQLTKTNPDEFFNHYQSIDWMVGKNKMKDWKAAARGWHARNKRWEKERALKINQYQKTYVKKQEETKDPMDEVVIGRTTRRTLLQNLQGWELPEDNIDVDTQWD